MERRFFAIRNVQSGAMYQSVGIEARPSLYETVDHANDVRNSLPKPKHWEVVRIKLSEIKEGK